jgi:hypothetical protein
MQVAEDEVVGHEMQRAIEPGASTEEIDAFYL